MADRASINGVGVLGGVNLLLRFLLELAMLAAFAAWGYRVADPLWLRIVLGIGAPLLAACAWGVLLAPRARRRLVDPARLALEVAPFGLAALALAAVGLPVWGSALAVLAVLNIGVLQALRLR